VPDPPDTGIVPRSLLWATDIDVLAVDRVVERREGYMVIRCPGNPTFYWGNLLLFDDPPAAGDGSRWERLFGAEFGSHPEIQHTTFGWDRVDGDFGAAREEFPAPDYEPLELAGLVATAAQLRPHPRESREVSVRALDPDADAELWDAVVELQVAGREDGFDEASYTTFRRARLEELKALFRASGGAWYVAVDRAGDVLASCGIVVTGTRGRFQAVDTAAAHRRRGISSRLLVEAARHSAEHYRAERFVIAADPDYHALGLYESLGFEASERVCGIYRRPPAGATSSRAPAPPSR
jgi:ribosomal protein S18 acetylase RimI-like enzyme